jgi:raffinose/stachyose/melibiose transport system substrate-binding protein
MRKVSRDRRLRAGLVGVATATALLTLAACGGTGNSSSARGSRSAIGSTSASGSSSATGVASASDPSAFTFLNITENPSVGDEIKQLSTGACATENQALPLQIQNVPQASLDQKLLLLAGQNALPSMFAAGNAPATTKTLVQGSDVVNFQTELARLGVLDDVEPAAISSIDSLYGGFNVLPTQLNIEGIFYNKKVFAQYGISVPTTWSQLVADAATLQAKGIQPFSASGQQGWPITRLISGYLYRSLGPGALSAVASGSAKLTDPQYVAAAQAIASLGGKGYFGKGVESIDYNTSVNTFLTGKAAMLYMGSWVLSSIADPSQDTIGAGNIGLMPFPNVTGGAGSSSQYPANVGLPYTFNAKTLGPKSAAWLKCVVQNYGSASLKKYDTFTGFVSNPAVTGLTPLETQVQQIISSTKQSVLWFEALFSTQATTVSQQDAAPLVNGSMSPGAFMSAVQSALAAS